MSPCLKKGVPEKTGTVAGVTFMKIKMVWSPFAASGMGGGQAALLKEVLDG
jgi:hypothetical protein